MRLAALLTVLITVISTSTQAETAIPATSVIPIYSQKVMHEIPVGWEPVFENSTDQSYMLEFVPTGQTVDNWTSMFTVQGFKGLSAKTDPKKILTDIGTMHMKVCGEALVFELVDVAPINGHETQGAVIGCAKMPSTHPTGVKAGMAEVAYYIAIKGKHDLYTFHKSIRTEAFDPKQSPVTSANAAEFIAEFTPLKLCSKHGAADVCL